LELLQSDDFREMESFSDRFIAANRKELARYSHRWAIDPLHQWSRQWEYPFVHCRIRQIASGRSSLRILDAGSGVTFFPHFMLSQFHQAQMYCSDRDGRLAEIHARVSRKAGNSIPFLQADLRTLLYPDEWFDIVYCISVLEHTRDYAEILDEFHRVLRPGGSLIVTFDVSLDGTRDLDLENGSLLLKAMAARFDTTDGLSLDLGAHAARPQAFTTLAARDINRRLLPWRFPAFMYRVKNLLSGKPAGSWPPLLSVFCIGLQKRGAAQEPRLPSHADALQVPHARGL